MTEEKTVMEKAGERLKTKKRTDVLSLSAADIEQAFYELELKNSMLEIQNEELSLEGDAVRAGLRKVNIFYESAAAGYFTFDPDGAICNLNPGGSHILGCKAAELVNRKFGEFVTVETRPEFDEFMQKLLSSGSRQSCELRIRAAGGITSFVYLEGTASGDRSKCYINAIDITDRRLAEETVYSLLGEKDLILKEVHHRVKNNMYNIGAMLNMQANASADPAAKSVLFDAAGRVQSMSVLYDKLYRSEHVNSVSLKEYLTDLVYEIVGIFPNKKMVKIKTDIADVALDAKILSILGILVNELITNSMKYAFAGRDEGMITVSASVQNKKAEIIMADNGKGIPETVTFENSKGFGMQLVGMLTEQIGGSIRIERSAGTKFVLEFEL